MEQSIWVPTKDLHLQNRGTEAALLICPTAPGQRVPVKTPARRSEPSYEYPEGSARTRPMDREFYEGLRRDLDEIVAQETGQEPDYGRMDLRSRTLEEIEDPSVSMAFPVVPGPGAYRRVTESDRARFLLHSRFRLLAITVSNPRA